MKPIYFLISLLAYSVASAQPNCQAFLYYGDTLKSLACEKSQEAGSYYQFAREYQKILDESLDIDSTFAFAYRAKSVAYLKSGDFITWKKLMDQAVKYDPTDNLGYRGWCRYQFFHDCEGAIKDLELLDSLVDYDIGFSVNGFYHLHIARALCYRALGQNEKALQIFETQLKEEDHFTGIYDYLHLGVMYMKAGELEKALEAFERQEAENDIAENRYYRALTHKELGHPNYEQHLEKAREFYLERRRMFDDYSHPIDKIYLQDIEKALAQ